MSLALPDHPSRFCPGISQPAQAVPACKHFLSGKAVLAQRESLQTELLCMGLSCIRYMVATKAQRHPNSPISLRLGPHSCLRHHLLSASKPSCGQQHEEEEPPEIGSYHRALCVSL